MPTNLLSVTRLGVVLSALALACSAPPGAPSPVTPEQAEPSNPVVCAVVFSPDDVLLVATDEGARRWGAAMDCDVTTGEGGIPVQLASSIPRPDGTQAPGVTLYERSLVLIHERARGPQRRRTLWHEMGHAMGADHNDEPASLMGGNGVSGDGIGTGEIIDMAALESVCRTLPCGVLTPEGQ